MSVEVDNRHAPASLAGDRDAPQAMMLAAAAESESSLAATAQSALDDGALAALCAAGAEPAPLDSCALAARLCAGACHGLSTRPLCGLVQGTVHGHGLLHELKTLNSRR